MKVAGSETTPALRPFSTTALITCALVLRAGEVTARQRVPLADEPQRPLALDGDLALRVVESVGGERGLVEHRHAVEVFGQFDEALEVDQHDVVHPYPGEVLQRANGERRAAEGERVR